MVKFSFVDEFLAELRKDSESVERKILRVTRRISPVDPTPMCSVAVVATAVVAGHVVQVIERCGETFRADAMEAKVNERAEKLIARLEEAAKELQLEVRAGVFE